MKSQQSVHNIKVPLTSLDFSFLFSSSSFEPPQSFVKHNKTFHKLFQEIPDEENLTHGECSSPYWPWKLRCTVFTFVNIFSGAFFCSREHPPHSLKWCFSFACVCVSFSCSVHLRLAEGFVVSRKALCFGELCVFLLIRAAERYQGNAHKRVRVKPHTGGN